MCGIFGLISFGSFDVSKFKKLARKAERRGRDSSGLLLIKSDGSAEVIKADFRISKLIAKTNFKDVISAVGHSRLITNGIKDNQPILRNDYLCVHNGIIVDRQSNWRNLGKTPHLEIDSELILATLEDYHLETNSESYFDTKLANIKGVINTFICSKNSKKSILYSNNGSLWFTENASGLCFSSEKSFLEDLSHSNTKVTQVNGCKIIDTPPTTHFKITDLNTRKRHPLIFELAPNLEAEKLLNYKVPELQRCSKCILPSTMPFITFDQQGVCNYCTNYTPLRVNKSIDDLRALVDGYRSVGTEYDCIIPFSGGRDSCYTLHLAVKELGLKPITYTYDWGMVTDLGRRNISRMCSELGVENIIFAANIEKKRQNIQKNVSAWLEKPHLGMINIFTAGDKHFFKFVDTVKKETHLRLNLWGINPLETTHFKTGFLGMPPHFVDHNVYSSGIYKQFQYQKLRTKEFFRNPRYINTSLIDTYSGEYFRSINKKMDYAHVFDYLRWDESVINNVLVDQYNWETAADTTTTWRIGDATAPFYNYIYHRIAGFTEHDTFRSNQIREGDLSRNEALQLVELENTPRYENIKWYLDSINLPFEEVIKKINAVPVLYDKS